MRRRLASILFVSMLVCLGQAACSRQDDTTIRPENSPRSARTLHSLSPEQEKFLALLGKPCTESTENVGGSGYYVGCGRDGLNGIVHFYGRVGMPKGAEALKGSRGDVVVGIEGRRVWVQNSCPMCRVNTDLTMIADLDHATERQLLDFQAGAEIRVEHAMRSAKEWEDAVDDWRPRH